MVSRHSKHAPAAFSVRFSFS